jgi:hypothetical protein
MNSVEYIYIPYIYGAVGGISTDLPTVELSRNMRGVRSVLRKSKSRWVNSGYSLISALILAGLRVYSHCQLDSVCSYSTEGWVVFGLQKLNEFLQESCCIVANAALRYYYLPLYSTTVVLRVRYTIYGTVQLEVLGVVGTLYCQKELKISRASRSTSCTYTSTAYNCSRLPPIDVSLWKSLNG